MTFSSLPPPPRHRGSSEYERRNTHHRTGSGLGEALLPLSTQQSYSVETQDSPNRELPPPPRRGSSLSHINTTGINGPSYGPSSAISNIQQLSPWTVIEPRPWYEGWTFRRPRDVAVEQEHPWEYARWTTMGLSQEELLAMINQQMLDGQGSVRLDYDALEFEDQRRHIDELVHEKVTTEISPDMEWTKASIVVEKAPPSANSKREGCRAVHIVLRQQARILASQSPTFARKESSDGYGSLPIDRADTRPPPPAGFGTQWVKTFPPSPPRTRPPTSVPDPAVPVRLPLPPASKNMLPPDELARSSQQPTNGLKHAKFPPPPLHGRPEQYEAPEVGIPERERRPYGREGQQTYDQRTAEAEEEEEHTRHLSEQRRRSTELSRQLRGPHSNEKEGTGSSQRRTSTTPALYSAAQSAPHGSTLGHTGYSSMGSSALNDDPEAGPIRRRFSDDHPEIRDVDFIPWVDGDGRGAKIQPAEAAMHAARRVSFAGKLEAPLGSHAPAHMTSTQLATMRPRAAPGGEAWRDVEAQFRDQLALSAVDRRREVEGEGQRRNKGHEERSGHGAGVYKDWEPRKSSSDKKESKRRKNG